MILPWGGRNRVKRCCHSSQESDWKSKKSTPTPWFIKILLVLVKSHVNPVRPEVKCKDLSSEQVVQPFPAPPILNIFFVKIFWIGPWVSMIDWCKGHWCGSTYMVVRLSSISPKPIYSIDPWTSWSRVRSKRINQKKVNLNLLLKTEGNSH